MDDYLFSLFLQMVARADLTSKQSCDAVMMLVAHKMAPGEQDKVLGVLQCAHNSREELACRKIRHRGKR